MTGLKVAPIAFGSWQRGGEWGESDEQQALAAIRQARELGVKPFDTAQGYGFGASEQLLGRALRDELDKRRDDVVIATKGGLRMTDDGLVRDASPNFSSARSRGQPRFARGRLHRHLPGALARPWRPSGRRGSPDPGLGADRLLPRAVARRDRPLHVHCRAGRCHEAAGRRGHGPHAALLHHRSSG
jgi:Aldo/keto reductase family